MTGGTPELGSYNFVSETKVSRATSICSKSIRCMCAYVSVPQETLDWADLVTLDFNLYDTPEGRKQLAQTLIKAVREDGFFYVKNFNISQERVNRQFAIGKRLYDIPVEEKLRYIPAQLGQSISDHRNIRDQADGCKTQTMGSTTAMYLLGAVCTLFASRSCEMTGELVEYSLDAETGLRDRVEVYNIPSQCHF